MVPEPTGKLDLDRIAKVIIDVNPDLVALQEVDQKVVRSGSVDQPAELAKLTKMSVAFGANLCLGLANMAMPCFRGFQLRNKKIIYSPGSIKANNAVCSN